MFLSIELHIKNQTDDGRTLTLEASKSASYSSIGIQAAHATGEIAVVLPPNTRLQDGDVITGYVRKHKHANG